MKRKRVRYRADEVTSALQESSTKDFDPEDMLSHENEWAGVNSELDESDGEVSVKKDGYLRLRGGIGVVDDIYSGRKVSRKDLSETSDNDDDTQIMDTVVSSSSDNESARDDKEVINESDSESNEGDIHILQSDGEAERQQNAANQMEIFDSLVGVRIRFQRALQFDARRSVEVTKMSEENSQLVNSLNRTQKVLKDTISTLISLQDELIDQNEEVNGEDVKKFEDGEVSWEKIMNCTNRIADFRDKTIQFWNTRTQLTSGTSLLESRQFRTLNQSVLSQVEESMKRMTADGVLDNEEFDDSQLYDYLVGSLLESKARGARYIREQVHSMPRKRQKREVDRKASKGRRIRYDVIPKLQNFMAQEPRNLPDFVDPLFSSIFGKKAMKL